MQIGKGLNKKRVYIGVLFIMLILSAIFLNSFYWPYEEISKRKILVGMIVFFMVVIVPILSAKFNVFFRFVEKITRGLEDIIVKAKENKKKIVIRICAALVVLGLSCVATYIISRFALQTTYNIHLFYAIIASSVIIFAVILSWKNAAHKPENIFVVIALTLGILCIGVTPDRVGVSWDDQVHYGRTLEVANFLNGIMYDADEQNIANAPFYYGTGYDRESNLEYREEMESLYATRNCTLHDFSDYGIWSVAFIPAAIGINLGRGLGLTYINVFNMGRLFNLLMYTSLVYFAIKRIKYGKVLIAAAGLIPTTIFMASSYSYDPWVIGFTILGFAYFFVELQDEAPLKNRNIFIMIGAIGLGCFPKAIYFPLLFPLLFMPKKKFQSSKQRRCFYWLIVGMGLFLVATFLLPMLVNGAGTGDVRGGMDVNSTEQIKYILSKPLVYAKTLYNFMLEYLALNNSGGMLQVYAYVGNGYFYSTVSLLLVVLAFLDRGENEKNYMSVKGAGLIGCAVAIVLSTTALYISFTAVGADTVAGMQGRYLVPTIYPALYSLGVGGTTHKINKNTFVCLPMLIIAFTFIYNMFMLCVVNY